MAESGDSQMGYSTIKELQSVFIEYQYYLQF
jgi:hypothetical protein